MTALTSLSDEDTNTIYKRSASEQVKAMLEEDFKELDKTYAQLDIVSEIENYFLNTKLIQLKIKQHYITYIEVRMENRLAMLVLIYMK